MDILEKIKQAGLVGRGGACFPVWKKWAAVNEALADWDDNGEKKCYVICNAAEGEPGITKDGYILKNFPEKVIDGMKIAMNFMPERHPASTGCLTSGYLYLNHFYAKRLKEKLASAINDLPIEIFIKPENAGYIGGEESAVLNAIEGKKIEPRLRPPFPTVSGLWGSPTLINNVETFYNVSLVNSGQYDQRRFFTITGACSNPGVYYLPESCTIEKILKETKNYPDFSFFVQVGGQASGEVLNSRQLRRRLEGAGSITIYDLAKADCRKIINNWLDFFVNETCGQCAPCREGTLRLKEIFSEEKVNWTLFNSLLDNLTESSLCALGSSVPIPIRSLIKNVFPNIK